jgi:fructokinase
VRIGIDLGGTKIEGVLLSRSGDALHTERISTPAGQDYEAILAAIENVVSGLRARATEPVTIGIGTPGSRSSASGLMRNCNTTSLNGKPLLEDLTRRLGQPIRMANDANCFALSEATDGSARGHRVVFGVILGTGVGGGLVIDGVVHEGPNGIAGEWGHTSIDPAGPACYCGDRGCVETYLSGPGLEADHHRSGGAPGSRAPDILRDAERGEALARASVERYLARFGLGLAAVIDVVDPDCVVLGGGMSHFDRLYSDGVDSIARHVFSDTFRTPVLPPTHGDSSGVRGAALLWP